MMPDLPNVGWERDMEAFREFFESPDFRADGLKLYPTLVIRGETLTALCVYVLCMCFIYYIYAYVFHIHLCVCYTAGTGLYELWKAGLYRNYHPERLIDLVARCARKHACWAGIVQGFGHCARILIMRGCAQQMRSICSLR